MLDLLADCILCRGGFTDLGSIPGQNKIMNLPVYYHAVNTVLWALVSNVKRVIIIHDMHEP